MHRGPFSSPLDAIVDVLLNIIGKQPGPVKGCVDLWIGCLTYFSGECHEKSAELRSRYGHVCRALFSLLTTQPSRRAVEDLESHFAKPCICASFLHPDIHSGLHRSARNSPTHPLMQSKKTNLALLIQAYGAFFEDTDNPSSLFKVKRNLRRAHRQWGMNHTPFPISPSDYFPLGDITGYKSFCHWMGVSQDWMVSLRIWFRVLETCQNYGFIVLATSPTQTQTI